MALQTALYGYSSYGHTAYGYIPEGAYIEFTYPHAISAVCLWYRDAGVDRKVIATTDGTVADGDLTLLFANQLIRVTANVRLELYGVLVFDVYPPNLQEIVDREWDWSNFVQKIGGMQRLISENTLMLQATSTDVTESIQFEQDATTDSIFAASEPFEQTVLVQAASTPLGINAIQEAGEIELA